MRKKRASKKFKVALLLLPVLAFVAVAAWYLHRTNIPVLEPAGPIGQKERGLMEVAILLSVIVVVPVYIMAIAIVLKYRESNHEKKKVKYNPDWDHSRLFESIWWGVPIVIIAILSVITWNSSHALDPYKPLASSKSPITVQVVAMDWKWVFIYPQQHVASVNMVELPVNTPVNFQITSDAVMNSFWIPQLGGQIYAMPGMTTQLHLEADRTGNFLGSPANIAGAGFARMDFTAKSVSQADFNKWTRTAAHTSNLNLTAYNQLARPSDNVQPRSYALATSDLYNEVVMKYMLPSGESPATASAMQGMEMQ